MRYVIFGSCATIIFSIIAFMVFDSLHFCHAVETMIEEKVSFNRYLIKLSFDGHTYILYRNNVNAVGDQIFHDPSCECLKQGK